MTSGPRGVIVGELELDIGSREVRRDGTVLAMQPRVFDVFAHLVEHRDRVVTKTELLATFWPGQAVVPDVLTSSLHSLRRILGDDPKEPRYIRTVHRVGYQLIARVDERPRTEPAVFPAIEARHAAFVGRTRETSLFAAMLSGVSHVQLLFVHGSPGIGKTTLLQELAYQARRAGTALVRVSGKTAGSSVLSALARQLHCDATLEAVRAHLAARPAVLFVDDVHLLEGADEWIRQELWPSLPRDTRLVLAGRRRPSLRWSRDPAWQQAAHACELEPLSEDETRAVFSARGRGLAPSKDPWELTRGHPLAIALVADAMSAMETATVPTIGEDDVMDVVVDWFTEQIDDPSRLRAFELACMLEDVSEPILAALDDSDSAASSLAWLSTLSFVEPGPDGIQLHPLVRETVVARLALRAPERLAFLFDRFHSFVLAQLQQTERPDQRLRLAKLFVGAGRHLPSIRANYEASDAGPQGVVVEASVRERDLLPDLVRRHEGEESARIVRCWLSHPGTTVTAVRDESDVPAGWVMTLRLGAHDIAAASAARDPLMLAIFRFLNDVPGEVSDEIIVYRTMIARDDYQAPSTVMRHLHEVKLATNLWHMIHSPTIAHTFSVYGEADLWEPVTASAQHRRMREHEVTMGARRFVTFHLSFRSMSVEEWARNQTRAILAALRAGHPPTLVKQRSPLDEPAFPTVSGA